MTDNSRSASFSTRRLLHGVTDVPLYLAQVASAVFLGLFAMSVADFRIHLGGSAVGWGTSLRPFLRSGDGATRGAVWDAPHRGKKILQYAALSLRDEEMKYKRGR